MDEQVVHKRPAVRHQAGVLRLANNQFRRVVASHQLHKIESLGPANFDLAHVAHVE